MAEQPERTKALTVALLLAAFPAGQSGATPPAGADWETAEEACSHFENRALESFDSDDIRFISLLAGSCRAALDRVSDRRTRLSPLQARLTAAYLDRLTDYRLTLREMNRVRAEEFARLRPWETWHARRTVTATGEYLIARRMGLLAIYSDWAAAAGFDIAAGE